MATITINRPNFVSYIVENRMTIDQQKEKLKSIADSINIYPQKCSRQHQLESKYKDLSEPYAKVIGFCKTPECRWKNPPTLSYDAGPLVHYNCIDCLAKYICLERDTIKSLEVQIVFLSTDVTGKRMMMSENLIKPSELLVSIHAEGVRINNVLIEAEWENVPADERTGKCIAWKLMVSSAFKYRFHGVDHYLEDFFIGHVQGKHICQNILLGKECHSIYDPNEQNPISKTITACQPNWVESHNLGITTKLGKIIINSYCYDCLNSKQSRSLTLAPSVSAPSMPASSAPNIPTPTTITDHTVCLAELADTKKQLTEAKNDIDSLLIELRILKTEKEGLENQLRLVHMKMEHNPKARITIQKKYGV